MNCSEAQAAIAGGWRERLVDVQAREAALAHARACERCAARLADERRLSAGLARLAEADQCAGAPARVEEALRAALRQSHPAAVRAIAPGRPRLSLRWAVAAAAALLLIAGWAAWRLAATAESPADGIAVVAPAPPEESSPAVEPDTATAATSDDAPAQAGTPRHVRRPRRQLAAEARPRPAAEESEIATDFLPLTPGGLHPMDGGQVVRVELPRAAMMRFGLPMNMERANERVKADVLIGNDGLARAIRFVR